MHLAAWLTGTTGVLIVLAHVLNPEISWRTRMISELSLGKYGWVMDLAYLSWMVAHIVLADALLPFVPVSLGILLGAIGVLQGLAGYFRTDPPNSPRKRPSRARRLHYATAIAYIVGFPIVILLLGLSLWTGGYPHWRRALVLAIPVWASFLFFVFLLIRWWRQGVDITRNAPIGLPNRLFVLTYLGWLFTMALKY